jgi:ABC-type branched-subunit amino acid transport system permease subunit
MTRLADRTVIGLLVAAAALLVLGFLLPDWVRFIVAQSFARGAVALGLLVLWRSGLISFGHALFFAAGAYAAVFMQRVVVNDAFAMALAGIIAGGLLAWILGFLLRRYRGIYFALLNLAFSMVLWGLLAKTEALGSTDGLGVAPPGFFGVELEGDASQLAMYCFSLVSVLIFAVAVHLYLRSTLGSMSTAVRENEIRLEYLGFSAERAVHVKYVISGVLGGFGGAIMGMTIGQVDPDSMAYWTISGEFVFITILGGTGNVSASFIGAFVFEAIRSAAFLYAPNVWQLIMGGTLLAIIMFLPAGLWSVVQRLRRAGA